MDINEQSLGRGEIYYSSLMEMSDTAECSAEISLPDYYPEIKRVVSVTAEALPDSKFLSEHELEYGGTVSFTVLYIGDDGSLSCVPYSGEYSGSVHLPEKLQINPAAVRITTKADTPQCRVTSPRKMSLKVRLRSLVSADGMCEYYCTVKNAAGENVSGEYLEFSESTLPTVCRKWLSHTGNVSGPVEIPEGAKPVSCSGTVITESVSVKNGTVTVRGWVAVNCIILNADGVYTTVCGKIPFEESVADDGVNETDSAVACGRAASVSVTTDSGGEATAEFDLDITLNRKSEFTVTDDLYSTAAETELSRTEISPICYLALSSGRLTLDGDILRRNNAADGYIVTSAAEPIFDKAEVREGKFVLSGTCHAKVYIADEGDIVCEEANLPFKYEANAGTDAASQEILWYGSVTAADLNAKLSGDKIHFSCELYTTVEAVKKYRALPVGEAVIGERYDCGEGCTVRICCPPAGMPVWEIGKKNHASLRDLERVNGVSRDGKTDGNPIIIL